MHKDELLQIVTDIISDAQQRPQVTAVAVGGALDSGLSVNVRLGTVDTVEFHRDKSIEILIYKGQRKGSVSITDLSPAAIDAAITKACLIADYTEADPYAGLADKDLLAKEFLNLDLDHPAAIESDQAIVYAQECEAAALGFDKRITNSDGASFTTDASLHVYANSDDFVGSYTTTRYSAACVVIGEQAGNMQRDYDFSTARNVHDLLAMCTLGISAAGKTIARLGASKIKTCQVPVLFVPRLASRLWGSLVAAISGGNLYRKRSFLLDALNTQILPEFVQINEQPHLLKALGSAPFDAEGVATRAKPIVSDGMLRSYLLGSYSARHLGMQSTGNAGGVFNFCVEPGRYDYAQLIKQMSRGLIVTEVMGQGTNIVSGDYSHGAAGFWVENGVIVHPVEEITIAGNLREMLRGIVAVGNDLDWRGNIISGSVLLDNMTVAGN